MGVKILRGEKAVLEKRLEAIRGSESFVKWKKWLALSDEGQKAIRDDWEAYYVACRNTESYDKWQEQKTAFSELDFVRVKELASQAEKRLNDAGYKWLVPPTSIDPDLLFFDPNVQEYYDVRKKLKTISQQLAVEGDVSEFGEDLFSSSIDEQDI